jgi:hypothetical protein
MASIKRVASMIDPAGWSTPICATANSSRHDVLAAHRRPDPTGHLPQNRVPDRMTQRVVHRLEVIEVQAQVRQRPSRLEPSERLLEILPKGHPVRQLGEHVGVG